MARQRTGRALFLGFLGATLALASMASVGHAQTSRVEVEFIEVASEPEWGYRGGVKQPLGAWDLGFNAHQITRYVPPDRAHSDPDSIMWVDERTGEAGVIEQAGEVVGGPGVNGGGMVAFDEDHRAWYVLASHPGRWPFTLLSSVDASTPPVSSLLGEFQTHLSNFEVATGSTALKLGVVGDDLMMHWRRYWSRAPQGEVKSVTYDRNGNFSAPVVETTVGAAIPDSVFDQKVTIEQVWSRHDPRFGVGLLTWHWFIGDPRLMGSSPVVLTDDGGRTWKDAAGNELQLPLTYETMTPVLMPVDHLVLGEHMDWHDRGLGLTPEGSVWTETVRGNADLDGWALTYCLFDDATEQWQCQKLAQPMAKGTAHATGATRDYMVMVYRELEPSNVLWARVSDDEGRIWTDPIEILRLDEDQVIGWASFNQPSNAYHDNAARFFISYHHEDDRFFNSRLGWVKVSVGCPGDLNADGTLNADDFFEYLALFSGRDPVADMTGPGGDGVPDGAWTSDDFFSYIERFAQGCQ